MSIEKLTDDLNIVQLLANRPTQSANEIKGEFDEAGNIIKSYINNVLVPEIENISGSLDGKVDATEFSSLETSLTEKVNEKITEVDSKLSKVSEIVTQYGDFQITTTASKTLDHGHGGNVTDVQEIKNQGYFPLGIVGYELSGKTTPNYDVQPVMLSNYLNNRVAGSCRTNVKISMANNVEWSYSSTYKLHILWIKIKEATETKSK